MSCTNTVMTINENSFDIATDIRNDSFHFWHFAKAIQNRKDFCVMAFSAIAYITAGLFFEEMLYDKMLAKGGTYTDFYLRNIDAALSWTENELNGRVQRCFAKGIREMAELNTKVRQATGVPFMRKIQKNDGLWDMTDVRAFIEDFEDSFNAHYNPHYRPGCYLRDIPWSIKSGLNEYIDA